MNLAVKLWQFVASKPVGMPDVWPAEVRELGQSVQLPVGNWSLMSLSEYLAYRIEHRAAYDVWEAAQV